MARNIALSGRRELIAHRRFVTGVTASLPLYEEVDSAGNKEWVIDVYIGPLERVEDGVIRKVPIAPYARNLVSDLRQPVTLERSKEGKYTVIGRSKVFTAGAQTPDGSIFEPTYHSTVFNLAELGLSFIADIDYQLDEFQDDPDKVFQEDPNDPFQVIRGFDAFGNQCIGPEAVDPPAQVDPDPSSTTTTCHTVLDVACFGPFGDPNALQWGEGTEFQPSIQRKVTVTE